MEEKINFAEIRPDKILCEEIRSLFMGVVQNGDNQHETRRVIIFPEDAFLEKSEDSKILFVPGIPIGEQNEEISPYPVFMLKLSKLQIACIQEGARKNGFLAPLWLFDKPKISLTYVDRLEYESNYFFNSNPEED